MNADGLLASIADAGKVAPFQPWAKGLYEYRQKTLLKDDPVPLSTPEPSAEDSVERDERLAQVHGALAMLTERDRDVLLLWDAGLSYPEIAAQTGLAVGAVGTTLARARKRLIEAYDRMDLKAHAARS